jgi:hypothetical protein
LKNSEWGTEVEVERRNRIRLTLAAYAYEYEDDPIMSDAEFDELSGQIDLSIRTGNDLLDDFFESEFSPDTGQWVRSHPEQGKLAAIYIYLSELKKGRKNILRIGDKVYEMVKKNKDTTSD